MASTYSEYLRLELIGTGEQTGTWGATTNTNLGTLLDQAVAGTATIDVTLGDVTLTALNGASDQSRQAILKITGTPIAARNVIAPESSKWYLISNECGQIITLKGASTTGYEIADGETLLMFWNGTDFVPGSSTALGYTPVNKAGDTMTGNLILNAAPSTGLGAATKQYVDDAVSGAVGGNFVLKTGDTMTGPLVLSGAPSTSLQAATKGYVDSAISGAGYATQSWVTSQNYANTSTQSLLYYYTKTDSDSRYVSTSTQNLQYYPLTTTVAATYATITAVNTALAGYLTTSGTAYNSDRLGNTAASGYVTTSGTQTIGGGKTFTGGINTNAIQSPAYNFTTTTSWYLSGGAVVCAISGTSTFLSYSSGDMQITGSNAIKASGTTWTNPSDIRLKDNVQDYTKGLQELKQINPKTWTFNGKGGSRVGAKGLGVIADEIQTVLPDSVSTYSAKLNESDETETEIKNFNADEIIWMLVNSVKELEARIAVLEAK